MQVVPVARVENKDIGAARVGPVARQIRHAYHELVRKECSGG